MHQVGAWAHGGVHALERRADSGHGELAGADALLDDRAEDLVVAAAQGLDAGGGVGGPVAGDEEEPQPSRVLADGDADVLVQQGAQAVGRASGPGGGELLQAVGPVVAERLDRGGAEFVLAAEVVVEGALGDVQPFGDVLQADRVVAALAEQFGGGREDLLGAAAAPPLHPARAGGVRERPPAAGQRRPSPEN